MDSDGMGGVSGEQAAAGDITGGDLMAVDSSEVIDGSGSNTSSKTQASISNPSSNVPPPAPGTSAIKALLGQPCINNNEGELRRNLARLYSVATHLVPDSRLHYRDEKGEHLDIDTSGSGSTQFIKILKDNSYEISPPVSILLPLLSLYTWQSIYLHSSISGTHRYLLPPTSLEREDYIDLVEEDYLTVKPPPSSTPLHLFLLPNSSDPFSSFTADHLHPQVAPWYKSSPLDSSLKLSTPDFDPFPSFTLPSPPILTPRDDATSSTRTEKAARPRKNRALTPYPSSSKIDVKSTKRKRSQEEDSEDGQSVKKSRKGACSDGCRDARKLDKSKWEQKRRALERIAEKAKEKLKRTKEESRCEKIARQAVQDSLDLAHRNLTVLGAKLNALEVENSKLQARLKPSSHQVAHPSTSESSACPTTPLIVARELAPRTPRKFAIPDPVKINARRKTQHNGNLVQQNVSTASPSKSSASKSQLPPRDSPAPAFVLSEGTEAKLESSTSGSEQVNDKAPSRQKKRSPTPRRPVPFAQPSSIGGTTMAPSTPTSTTDPTAALADHHGHDWARRSIRASLGVPAVFVPDHETTIYFDTGDRNLQPTPFYPMRGQQLTDMHGNSQEGFLACPRFDPDDNFVKHALSLRQTPGENNGARQSDAFKRFLKDCPRFQVDAYACAQSWGKPWKTTEGDQWAIQFGAEANVVMDRASYATQKVVINEINERYKVECRKFKVKDAERCRLVVTLVETSHIGKQHSKKMVGYCPRLGCLIVWNPSCNLSTCGHALDRPTSSKVPMNCSYETSSMLFLPLGTYASDHELDELDKLNFGLQQRQQFVPVVEELIVVNKKENEDVKQKRKQLEKAREKAAKEHQDSLGDNFHLLDSFAPPPLPSDALTFSITRPQEAQDLKDLSPPAPTEPFCHRLDLATNPGQLKEGDVAGLIGCARCGGFAGRTFSQIALKRGSRSDVNHPQTDDGMEYNPFCLASNSLGSPLFVIRAEEVAARGTWENVMREEFEKLQSCKLASSKCPLMGLIFEWYSSLTRDLVGFADICANGLAFSEKIDHPEKPYFTKLCDGLSNHNLSKLLHSEFGSQVYSPAGKEKKEPRLRAHLAEAVATRQIQDAMERHAARSGSTSSDVPTASTSNRPSSHNSQARHHVAATSGLNPNNEEDTSDCESDEDD